MIGRVAVTTDGSSRSAGGHLPGMELRRKAEFNDEGSAFLQDRAAAALYVVVGGERSGAVLDGEV